MDGLPKASNKSKYDLDGGGGQVSLLIRLSHKVGGSGSWILGASVVRFHFLDHGCVALHAFTHDPTAVAYAMYAYHLHCSHQASPNAL